MGKVVEEKIIIDHREPDEVVERLLLRDRITTIEPEAELTVGDYEIGSALFERKTVGDLESSMTDGRLKSQIKRMMDGEREFFVLIQGDISEVGQDSHGPPSESVRGYCASLMARFRVPIVFCSNMDIMIDMMIRMGEKANDESKEVIINSDSSFREIEDPMVRFLTTIDGIGVQTGEKISDHFPYPSGLIGLEPQQLTLIDGVGATTARKIVSSFNPEEYDA
jgi:DNA excision repair protein ERCC-4